MKLLNPASNAMINMTLFFIVKIEYNYTKLPIMASHNEGIDIIDIDMSKTILEYAMFSKCNIIRVSFKDAKLVGCMFDDCRFIEVNFDRVILDAMFNDCIFINCTYNGADLSRSNKTNCQDINKGKRKSATVIAEPEPKRVAKSPANIVIEIIDSDSDLETTDETWKECMQTFIHNGRKKYKCIHCNTIYAGPRLVQRHILTWKETGKHCGNYMDGCPDCEVKYDTICMYIQHMDKCKRTNDV